MRITLASDSQRAWLKAALSVVFMLALAMPLARADDNPHADVQSLLGTWYDESHEGVIELYACDAKVCGRFHWLKDDSASTPSLDDHNPDPEKRRYRLCGEQFMGEFKPRGNGSFEEGWIYSPRHGERFSASMTLIDADHVRLKGYIFLPLFGDSQIWTRAVDPPGCAVY